MLFDNLLTLRRWDSAFLVIQNLLKSGWVTNVTNILTREGLRAGLGAIHMEMLLCVNAYVLHSFGQLTTWILWMMCLKPGLRVEKSKNAALVFSYGQRICIFCILMTPLSHPLTCSHRPLNAANLNNNNNNNSGLPAYVPAAEVIEPIRVTRAKYYAPLPLRWAKKDYGQPASHFSSSSSYVQFLFLRTANCGFSYKPKRETLPV